MLLVETKEKNKMHEKEESEKERVAQSKVTSMVEKNQGKEG